MSRVVELNGFIALVALMIGAVVLYRYRNATRVCYGITDRRLVILSVSGSTRKIESYGARDVQFVERRQRKEELGDVIFARNAGKDGKGTTQISMMGLPLTRFNDETGFFGIRDAAVAESMVRRFKDGASVQR